MRKMKQCTVDWHCCEETIFLNLIFHHVQKLGQDPDQDLDRHRNGNPNPDRHRNHADPQHENGWYGWGILTWQHVLAAAASHDPTRPSHSCPLTHSRADQLKIKIKKFKSGILFGFFSFCVRYSTLLYLPPMRFHCVGDAGIELRHYQPDAVTTRLNLIHHHI